jgi:hypothetical protein
VPARPSGPFLPAAGQALPAGKGGEKHLLLWTVEDAVKSRYSQFIGLLEATSVDTLDYLKVRGRGGARRRAAAAAAAAAKRGRAWAAAEARAGGRAPRGEGGP